MPYNFHLKYFIRMLLGLKFTFSTFPKEKKLFPLTKPRSVQGMYAYLEDEPVVSSSINSSLSFSTFFRALSAAARSWGREMTMHHVGAQ